MCPELAGFLGSESFRAESEEVSGKLGQAGQASPSRLCSAEVTKVYTGELRFACLPADSDACEGFLVSLETGLCLLVGLVPKCDSGRPTWGLCLPTPSSIPSFVSFLFLFLFFFNFYCLYLKTQCEMIFL